MITLREKKTKNFGDKLSWRFLPRFRFGFLGNWVFSAIPGFAGDAQLVLEGGLCEVCRGLCEF